MRELQTVRLLPLCGLVAFPGTPPIATTVPDEDIAIDAPVGLLHCQRDSSLTSVGSLAQLSASIGSNAFTFEAFERFRVVEIVSDDDNLLLARWEPHVDAPFTSDAQEAEATRLHDELWEKLLRIEELSEEDEPGRALPHLAELQPGTGSPSDFSLALAGSVDLGEKEAQHLLECDECISRLRTLDEIISESLSFGSAQVALSRLGL